MRPIYALSGVLLGAGILAGATYPAAADTTNSTSGAGASVAIVSGSNGGVTVIVDSQHPCRTQTAANGGSRTTGSSSTTGASGSSSSTSVGTGAGGLSGSATAGSGGTSVNIGPGGNGTASSASSEKNVAAANECVVIIKGPAGK